MDCVDGRKKVLIVISSLEQGGGQKLVMDLAKGLDRDRFEVRVLVYYGKTGSVFDVFAEKNGIDTVYLDKSPGLKLSLFNKVKKAVREFNPDIIHTHLHTMLYLFTSYKRKHIKLHTVHTLAEKETQGLQKIVRFIAYKIFGVVPVGICDLVADSIAKEHGIRRERIPVVYNGVDCSRYNLPKVESQYIRLVSVGNIYPVKNYLFLVECFAEVCSDTNNLKLQIVGDGVQRVELEEKIHSLGLSDKVSVTGVVSNVENYLADADVYVACSLFEGLPISMLEAMAAGLPIVSTDVGGVREIVISGTNGYLVPLGEKEQYVDALKKVILDKEARNRLSDSSKKMSLDFDVCKMIEGYSALYSSK